jgi:hypothetical protein
MSLMLPATKAFLFISNGIPLNTSVLDMSAGSIKDPCLPISIIVSLLAPIDAVTLNLSDVRSGKSSRLMLISKPLLVSCPKTVGVSIQ